MPVPTNLTSGAGSSATSFTTASVAPTGARLILVVVHAYISTGSVQPSAPSVVGNGITYTLVTNQTVDTAGVDRANIFVYRGMAASPSSGTIVIDFAGVTMTRCAWSVEQSDSTIDQGGTNGLIAVAQSIGALSGSAATSLSTNYAPAITTGNTGYAAFGHQSQEGKTPRSGWTELVDVTSVTLATLETQYIDGTDSAGSATWTTAGRAGSVIMELKAAGAFTYLNEYGLQGGTTTLTMVPPSGTASGDLEVIWVANKNSSVDPTDPSGWTRIDSQQVGTGADGVGTGLIRLTAWYRILTGTSTNSTITITAANRSLGGGMVFHKTSGAWAVPTATFGSDTDSSTTTFTALMAGNLAAVTGDYVISVGVFTANTTLPGRTLTVPGSNTALYQINSGGGATGNQIFLWTDMRTVMSTTQTGASTTGATSGVGTTGGAINLRVGLSAGTSLTLGLASTTSTAYAPVVTKSVTLGLASTSSTAYSPTVTKDLSAAVETDTARGLVNSKAETVGLSQETDTARVLANAKAATLGLAAEVDSALVVNKAVVTSLATETDTARVLSASKAITAGLATETDTAQALVATKTVTLSVAVETDTARTLTATKSFTLSKATETDIAYSLVADGSTNVLFGRALETDTAQGLLATKTLTLGRATETDTAYAVSAGGSASATLGIAAETDTARGVVITKTYILARAVETDTARALVTGVVIEFDSGSETFATVRENTTSAAAQDNAAVATAYSVAGTATARSSTSTAGSA